MTMTRRLLLAAAATAAAVAPSLALAPGSWAASASGVTTIQLKGTAWKSLSGQGVKATAVSPAKRGKTSLSLPASSLTTGKVTTVAHRGGIRLRVRRKGKTRTVTLTSVSLRVGSSSSVRAKVRGRTVTLFSVKAGSSARTVDASAGRASVKSSKLVLTKTGAAALRRALGLRKLPASQVGTLRSSVSRSGAPSAPGGSGGSGGSTGGSGGGGGGGPVCRTVSAAGGPTAPTRPAGALDVVAGRLTWTIRESFVRYINVGEGLSALAPATLGAPVGGLVYDVTFPLRDGWYDPSTKQLALRFDGTVCAFYTGHTIELRVSAPELEIGPNERVVAQAANETGGAPAARVNLANLSVAGRSEDTRAGAGPTYRIRGIPATVAAGGSDYFGGFYPAGQDIGKFSVEFTTGS